MRRALIAAIALMLSACSEPKLLAPNELRPAVGKPTARIAYGPGPSQFAEFWRPAGRNVGRRAVAVLLHGGCWQEEYGLDLMDPMADALSQAGFAVWNIEYRRLGETGASYPGAFQDVAAGIDALRRIAGPRRLDMNRIVLVGHSAGGHLALWASARAGLPADSPLRTGDPLPVNGVLSLGGVGDLRTAATDPNFSKACGADTPAQLVDAANRPGDPYADTSPSELPPTPARQVMLHGERDPIAPPRLGESYAAQMRPKGGRVELVTVPGGHFEVIAPEAEAWRTIADQIDSLSR